MSFKIISNFCSVASLAVFSSGNAAKTGTNFKKMIVGFGIRDPKLGKYNTFLGVTKFLSTDHLKLKKVLF